MTAEQITVDLEDVEAIINWWRSANDAPGGCSYKESIDGMRDAVWGLEQARRLQTTAVLTPPPPPGLPAPSGFPEENCEPCSYFGDVVRATYTSGWDNTPTCDFHADGLWSIRRPHNTKD